MLKRIDQVRRAALTGFAFALFGSGGVVVAAVLFPLLVLMPGSEAARRRRGQRVIHRSFRFFIWLWTFLGLLTYTRPDLSRLNQPGQLIIANHPSLIDVVFLISFIKEANCVIKRGLYLNPFTIGVVMAARYISNADSDALIDDCAATLKAGNSLIIFPEGTRTTYGEPMHMQRGAANIALRAGVPLVPVVIHCSQHFLTRKASWRKAPQVKPHFNFEILPPIPLPLETDYSSSKQARILTREIDRCLSEAYARKQRETR